MTELSVKRSSASDSNIICYCYCMWTYLFDADFGGLQIGGCGCACPHDSYIQMGDMTVR